MSDNRNYNVVGENRMVSRDDILKLFERVRKLEELILPLETVPNFDKNVKTSVSLGPLSVINSTSTKKSDEKKKDNEAFIIYIESVDKFWIQEEKSTRDLELMEEELSTANSWPTVTTIKNGMMCVAKYSSDGLYYRARIISHNDAEATVFFVDYGNTEQCNDLREITDDLANVKPLARRCCLIKPDGVEKWPNNVDEEFKKLFSMRSSIFLLDILEEDEICLVKLGIHEYDVAQELIKLCNEDNEATAPNTEDRISPIMQENRLSHLRFCQICLCESPKKFWIQHDPSQLKFITEKMKYAKYFEKNCDIKEGDLVAIKYKDKLWYRARVEFHGRCSTNLILVDIGFSMVVNSQFDFYKLPKDLNKIPPLATRCCLKRPQELKDWPTEVCDNFYKLSKKNLKFQIDVLFVDKEYDFKIVALFYNGKNVKDIILNMNKY